MLDVSGVALTESIRHLRQRFTSHQMSVALLFTPSPSAVSEELRRLIGGHPTAEIFIG